MSLASGDGEKRWTLKIEQCMKHHENDGGTR